MTGWSPTWPPPPTEFLNAGQAVRRVLAQLRFQAAERIVVKIGGQGIFVYPEYVEHDIGECGVPEQIATTNIYLHADMTLKETAIAKVTPLGIAVTGRYQPTDTVLAFLATL